MSHTTTIRGLRITDDNAVRTAVQALQQRGVQIELQENAVPRMYYEHQAREVGECPFVLKLPNSRYDVGLQRQADGTLEPKFDEFAGDVSQSIGGQCAIPTSQEEKAMWAIGQFSQEYAKAAAINAASAQGYTVTGSSMDAQGNVHVEISV